MEESRKYTTEEAHLYFAKNCNGKVWELLDKADRSSSEDELMVHAAHASCFHWLMAGTGVHHQRAEWLLAHVYTVRGMAEQALLHARRCLELTQENVKALEDFDKAYAFEGEARAQALAGNRGEALKYLALAEDAGNAIAGEENKKVFLGDLEGGDWYGMR